MVISSCERIMKNKKGKMGQVVPGHNVEIVDKSGQVVERSVV